MSSDDSKDSKDKDSKDDKDKESKDKDKKEKAAKLPEGLGMDMNAPMPTWMPPTQTDAIVCFC
jgi:hypothetical protein